MTDVRSVALGCGFIVNPGNYLVVVGQTGLTLLAKTLYISGTLAASQTVSAYLVRPAVAGPMYLAVQTLPAGQQVLAWEGWVVLAPGDELRIGKSTSERLDYWISGTALHGVDPVYQPIQPRLVTDDLAPLPA